MGLLDGGMQGIFGAAFGGLYLAGTLIRVTLTDDGEGGWTETTAEVAIKGQVDAVNERIRQSERYVDGDARLIVLQDGVATPPKTDDRITLGGETWGIYAIMADPANTHWEMGGRRYGVSEG